MRFILRECHVCGETIELPHNYNKEKIVCSHCNAVYHVDVDAEFIDGSWKNLTKLIRV